MATKKTKRRNGKKKFTLPLAVVGGFAPLAINTMRTSGGFDRKLWMFAQATTGYDIDTQRWWLPNLNKGMTWIVVGGLIHLLASKIGLNRALSGAGIPFIRI